MRPIKIVFEDIYPFDLAAIAEGGQAFRWNRLDDGGYVGVVGSWVINALQQGDRLYIETNAQPGSEEQIKKYFDLERDYTTLEEQLSQYDELVPAVQYCSGYRILRQDPWETTISFIISSNNNIRNIKNTVERLCKNYGEPLVFEGEKYYSFPTAEVLAKVCASELGETRCGYRARYIQGAARMVAEGELDLKAVKEFPTRQAKKELLKLPGVGPKVADCILLYSMQKFDAFPVDVWIKRGMEILYYDGADTPIKKLQTFAEERFGSLAGFAQQYMFHYSRTVMSKQK